MNYDIAYPVVSDLDNIPDAEMCQWYCVQLFDCDYFVYFTESSPDTSRRKKCFPLRMSADGTGGAGPHAVRGPKICP